METERTHMFSTPKTSVSNIVDSMSTLPGRPERMNLYTGESPALRNWGFLLISLQPLLLSSVLLTDHRRDPNSPALRNWRFLLIFLQLLLSSVLLTDHSRDPNLVLFLHVLSVSLFWSHKEQIYNAQTLQMIFYGSVALLALVSILKFILGLHAGHCLALCPELGKSWLWFSSWSSGILPGSVKA